MAGRINTFRNANAIDELKVHVFEVRNMRFDLRARFQVLPFESRSAASRTIVPYLETITLSSVDWHWRYENVLIPSAITPPSTSQMRP